MIELGYSLKLRMTAALAGSVAVNVLVWGALASVTAWVVPRTDDPALEVERVVIEPKVIRPQPAPSRPNLPPKAQAPDVSRPKPEPRHDPTHPVPVRTKVITARDSDPSKPDKGFVAPPDGNSAPGKPVSSQGQGEIKGPPPAQPQPPPPPKQADPVKQPEPTKPEPVKQPDPPKVAPPKPVEPAKPKGPTKDAEPASQIQPEIPDDLKSTDLKTFVRVRVEIHVDGSFQVVLRTSSGRAEVDKLIIDALKRWKWRPALKEGDPVKSTQAFRFEIEVK